MKSQGGKLKPGWQQGIKALQERDDSSDDDTRSHPLDGFYDVDDTVEGLDGSLDDDRVEIGGNPCDLYRPFLAMSTTSSSPPNPVVSVSRMRMSSRPSS